MSNKVTYGGQEIRVSDDEDLAAIAERFADALRSPDSPWVEIKGNGATHRLLVTPGVAVQLTEAEKRPSARRAVVMS